MPNSLFVNSTLNTSQNNPISINLSPFSSQSISTITFKAQVTNTIPTPNPILNSSFIHYTYTSSSGIVALDTLSNTVLTTISYGSLFASKQVDKPYAQVGDTLTYIIPLVYYVGNVPLINTILIDTLPSYLTLKNIFLDNITIPGPLNSPGISIGTIPVNSIRTLTYTVIVNTLPNPNIVTNSAFINYDYLQGTLPSSSALNTNTTLTTIINPSISITKLVDKNFSTVHDTLTYTILIKNNGNINLSTLNFTDTISSSLTYVPGTLTLDFIPIGGTPNSIFINTIQVSQTITIQYQVFIN